MGERGGEMDLAPLGAGKAAGDGVPLDAVHVPSDFDQLIFDAYDNDGIYLLGIGDAYKLRQDGPRGHEVADLSREVRDELIGDLINPAPPST